MSNERFDRTLGYRLHNPLNIRYAKSIKWQGQEGAFNGFVIFGSFSCGYRAAVKILNSYRRRGITTIGGIISTWAPRSENDTDAYIKSVLQYMNGVFKTPGQCTGFTYGEINADTGLNLKDREMVVDLLMAMTSQETGAGPVWLHKLKSSMYLGYDLAVTSKDFFK